MLDKAKASVQLADTRTARSDLLVRTCSVSAHWAKYVPVSLTMIHGQVLCEGTEPHASVALYRLLNSALHADKPVTTARVPDAM